MAYFSNPGITYQGDATGDAADGDNARTLREIRTVIAGYRPTANAPECTIDGDCSGGQVCVNNECVECADDGDCTGGEVCSNNTCVECVDDGDCTGGELCSNKTCVECAKDGDCIDGTCESNVCIPYECTDDGDCTGGEVCLNNMCVECANDTTAPAKRSALIMSALSAPMPLIVMMANFVMVLKNALAEHVPPARYPVQQVSSVTKIPTNVLNLPNARLMVTVPSVSA